MGTIGSRSDQNFIGGYPGEALYIDAKGIANKSTSDGNYRFLHLISLPVDFVADTILLPFDLITWPFGMLKRNPENYK
jgi:uncharacterized protein YceK